MCLVSEDAVGHAANTRQNFSKLTVDSPCDNVLLEHQLALELKEMGCVDFIYPVFIGKNATNDQYENFQWSCYGKLPDVSVTALESKLTGHLERQALGVPLRPDRTVRQVVDEINAHQGFSLKGDKSIAFEAVTEKIVNLCKSSVANAQEPISKDIMISAPNDSLAAENALLRAWIDDICSQELSSRGSIIGQRRSIIGQRRSIRRHCSQESSSRGSIIGQRRSIIGQR